jgi:serine/threonine-protein kinase ULK4
MNNYQIYEEVGKGRYSTVYKGRKKRSIEYYAIASIDKGQRQRVLNSVHYIRALNHPKIVKFHNWYETNNHLWVITEYCTGGDLKSVLSLEESMPETATKIFATDLVEGLSHLHSNGVVYADLKPSNILMDACAVLRFYDFGLAQSIDNVRPENRVGTPSYMAPELFLEGGVHSFASDLWSLGCMLYEMASGRPPFVDTQLQGLIERIVGTPHSKVEGYSKEFNDLLDLLLQKDPLQRGGWADVSASDWWQSGGGTKPFIAENYPSQPAFDSYKKSQLEARKARPPQQMEKIRREDVLRASINAERNLARECKGEDGNGSITKIGVDHEIDFREPPPETDTGSASGGGGSSFASSDAAAAGGAGQVRASLAIEMDNKKPVTAANHGIHPFAVPAANRPAINPNRSLTLNTGEIGQGPSGSNTHSTRESEDVLTVESLLNHPSDNSVRQIMLNPRIERIAEPKFDAAELTFKAPTAAQVKSMPPQEQDELWAQIHKSLSEVSSAMDKANTLAYLHSLTMESVLANAIIKTQLMGLWVKMLSKPNIPANLKAIICTIIGMVFRHASLIPVEVQDTNVLPVLLQCMSDPSPRVRRRSAAALGELLFYMATQTPDARQGWKVPKELCEVVLSSLSDSDDVVVHYVVRTMENIASLVDRSFASLFASKDFVATLIMVYEEEYATPTPSGAPTPNAGNLPSIQTPSGQGNAPLRSEHLRSAALGAALRLAMVDPLLIHLVVASLPPSRYASLIASSQPRTTQSMLTFMNYLLSKAVAILLQTAGEQHLVRFVQWTNLEAGKTIFSNSVLSSQMVMETTGEVMKEAGAFMSALLGALEHTNPAIRGKACLLTLFLSVVDPSFLGKVCEYKLLPAIERNGTDADLYVMRSAMLLSTSLRAFISTAINTIAQCSLQTVDHVLPDLDVMVRLLEPASLRLSLILDDRFFVDLGHSVRQLDQFSERNDYQRHLFSLVEMVIQDAELLVRFHVQVLSALGPPLLSLLKGGQPDLRFQALKIVHDIANSLLSNSEVYNPAVQSPSIPAIHEFLMGVLPLVDSLLEEAEPIPLYTIKFLSVCCEQSTTILAQLARNTLVGKLLGFFDSSRNNNIYVTRTLLRMIQSGGEALILFGVRHGLVGKLSASIKSIVASFPSSTRPTMTTGDNAGLDPVLEMIFFVLCSCAKTRNQAILSECGEWPLLVADALLLFCLYCQESTAECSASCINLLSQLYPDSVAQQLLAPRGIAILRELFGTVENLSSHIVLPLLRALYCTVTECSSIPPQVLNDIRQNELFLIQLQSLGDRYSSTSPDIGEVANNCINRLLSN